MPMTRREAEKLLREHGASFVRRGGNHDIWETTDGQMIPLPRHRFELSPGVERALRGALGLQPRS